jgi:hypothetical protein
MPQENAQPPREPLGALLQRVTDETNAAQQRRDKANGNGADDGVSQWAKLPPDTPGRDHAVEIEHAHEVIANAIMECADHQLAVAQSLVREAELHLQKAKQQADAWRDSGRHAVLASLHRHKQLSESSTALVELHKKLEAVERGAADD